MSTIDTNIEDSLMPLNTVERCSDEIPVPGCIYDKETHPNNDYTQEENKIDMRQANIQYVCVKNELEENKCISEESNHSLVKSEDIKEDYNLIDLDKIKKEKDQENLSIIPEIHTDVMIKEELPEIKDTSTTSDYFYCNACGNGCQGTVCSSLTHLLNNSILPTNSEWNVKTIPTDILEFKDTINGKGVFALKTLPKNVIFGPFDGAKPIESTNGYMWKLKKDRKLMNIRKANWMQYIAYSKSAFLKNLDVFQFECNLYFQTNGEIKEGDELLVYFNDDEIQQSNGGKERYYMPVVEENSQQIFACTHCCLGFSTDKCLIEHKSKCPHSELKGEAEIIQCNCCKIKLEKLEHLDHHAPYCWDNSTRKCSFPAVSHLITSTAPIQIEEIDIESHTISDKFTNNLNRDHADDVGAKEHFNSFQFSLQDNMKNEASLKKRRMRKYSEKNTSKKIYNCVECSFKTDYKSNLQSHIRKHTDIKLFQCDTCNIKFKYEHNLKCHIRIKHNGETYNCPQCPFQTTYKHNLRQHLDTHSDVKPFACDFCQMRFSQKSPLKSHIKSKHSDGIEKDYKCEKCSYGTNHRRLLDIHLKNKHTEAGEKDYKCTQCSFQSNYKESLRKHLHLHSGIIYACKICHIIFTQKDYLKRHIKNKHTEIEKEYRCDQCSYETNNKRHLWSHTKNQHTEEKDYKCSLCSFQTNFKRSLQTHLDKHEDESPQFQCKICLISFPQKGALKIHIKDKHPEGYEKDFKCTQCPYETNIKNNLQAHLNTHSEVKLFPCDFCKKRFSQKSGLNNHLKNHCSVIESTEKVHKCSQCSFETSIESRLKKHLDIHSDVKPFVCDICQMGFHRSDTLKTHVRNKHTEGNEKDYKCDQCSFETHNKRSFQAHLNIHSDVRPYQCDTCQMGFNQKSCLKMHIKNKHAGKIEKDYKCEHCFFQTNYKRSLRSHRYTHSDVKPYQCDVCQLGFVRNYHLIRHKKRFAEKSCLNT